MAVWVNGYYRKDGTYVKGYWRSSPDDSVSNNWSTIGNVNPYTGEAGTKPATPSSTNLASTDKTLPTVSEFFPANQATQVPINSNIVITFSEPIARGTGNITLKTSTGLNIATFDAASSSNLLINGSTLTIKPRNSLSYETSYKVELTAGTVRDLVGNSYTGTASYNFTTESQKKLLGTQQNDTLNGGSGSKIDGLNGIDVVTYQSKKGSIEHNTDGTWSVGSDILSNVERLQFSNEKLALDIEGNAGKVAKVLAATFGASAVFNKEYAGIGLKILDEGMSYETLAALAINSTGAQTRDAVVDLLWTNLTGSHPTPEQAKPFIDLLATDLSNTGALGVIAADYAALVGIVDLNALAKGGLSYF